MLATKILLTIVVLLTIVLPIGAYFIFGKKNQRSYKRTLAINLLTFFAALIVAQVVVFSGTAHAADSTSATGIALGLGYVAAGLSTGLACIGSGIAVSASASAALGALTEDSSILGKSLIFVGLSEGIALYGLIISFMILGAL